MRNPSARFFHRALFLLGAGLAASLLAAPDHTSIVYFGTSTTGANRGIYAAEFDSSSGVLSPATRVAETSNPVFVAIHPNHKWLYSLGEVPGDDGKPVGILQGYVINPETGGLTLINRRLTGGKNPCHLTIDQTGRFILTTNYNGGFVAVYSLDAQGQICERTALVQHSGPLGPTKDRQDAPHAHSVNLDSSNRFAIVCDLGLDKVFVYHFDSSNGTLTPNTPPSVSVMPGGGPRHLAFHPNGKFAYVIDEVNSSMTAFAWDKERGVLTQIQEVHLIPEDYKQLDTSAEVVIHKSGKFLYASNRGYDSLRVFAIDQKTGLLTFVMDERDSLKHPRNFLIDPSGRWLVCANRDADTATTYAIDQKTGALTYTGRSISVPQAICVRFLAR